LSNEPAWNASWIWLPGARHKRNLYAEFRKSFRLSSKPRSARLHISAFTHYRLYVNGVEVGSGPNPADPAWYYYDFYNVASLLKSGKNVVAVLAYNPAAHLWCDVVHAEGVGGALIAELVTERPSRVVCTDASWRVRRAPAWQANTPGFTELRVAFKEYVDGRKGFLDFVRPGFNDAGWQKAEVLGPHPMKPFLRLLGREIGRPRVTRLRPVNASSVGYNFAYGFSEGRGWEIVNTTALIAGYPVGNDHRLTEGGAGGAPLTARQRKAYEGAICEARAPDRHEHPSILLDFGRLCVGRPRLVLADAPAGARIDIAYGEGLNLTYIDRYICRQGPQEFSPFHRRAGRYMLLTFRMASKPVRIREVSFDAMRPNLPERGSFHTGDAKADRVFRVAADTVAVSMQDHYEDSVWRELKLMVGDMRVQALASYYTLGAYRYNRKCIRQMARIAREDGWIPPGGPARQRDVGLILDFPAHYVATVRDYVLYSGDMRLGRELYPVAAKQLRNYDAMPHTEGLIDTGYKASFKWWVLIDWNEVDKRGVVAPLNMFVVDAFEAGAQLAGLLGHESDAAKFRRRAACYRKRIDEVFWDSSQRLYIDAIAHGRPSKHSSVNTNALALMTGVARGPRRRALVERFRRKRWLSPCPFFQTFVIEALMRHAGPRLAWDYLFEYWGEMVDRGADTFWEAFDLDAMAGAPAALPHKLWSRCHGWSAAPAYFMGAYLLGLRPAAPGFGRTRLAPMPSPFQTFTGSVPTPKGKISIECDRKKKRIALNTPNGVEIEPDAGLARHFSRITVNGRAL